MIRELSRDLLKLLGDLQPGHYCEPCSSLSGASIGQHVRHSLEMFQCLGKGYQEGKVNYDLRKRDLQLECSPVTAAEILKEIGSSLQNPDKPLILENGGNCCPSSFSREIIYCSEHLIHHLALIKIGLNELGHYRLSENFGVAPSTIKYRQECAR